MGFETHNYNTSLKYHDRTPPRYCAESMPCKLSDITSALQAVEVEQAARLAALEASDPSQARPTRKPSIWDKIVYNTLEYGQN